MSELRTVRGACPHDCPDTCAFVVSVDPASGRAVKLRGDPNHRTTGGFLCVKVNHYLDRTYHPDRVLYPQIRVGKKGEGRFRRVSWEEALALVAARLKAVSTPEAILPYSYSGTLGLVQNGSIDRRFFHVLGASQLDRTICASAGTAALESVLGHRVGPEFPDLAHARLILAWGTNLLTSNVHAWPFIQQARAAGAELVVIDPIRTRTAERADWFLAPKPGSDAALALGMMHVIFRDGLADRAYLEAHTEGHRALEKRALEEWPLTRAASETGLAAEEIERLARRYATVRPSFIRLNYGLQRHFGGASAVRAIVSLPAVVGAWRDPGGGALLSTSGAYPTRELGRPDLMPEPEPRRINMNQLGAALDRRAEKPVEALFVYASNPAAVAPDQEAVLRGLAREDLFTVVHEIFPTDTARYADVLLPATTQLEQLDIHKSYGHLDVLLNQPAIAPLGEAVSNTELFRRLSRAMGLAEPSLYEDDETLARAAFDFADPRMRGITYERLRDEGPQRLALSAPYQPFAAGGFFGRPDGRCRFEDPSLAAFGLDPLIDHVPPKEQGPLTLLSPPAHSFLNSSFANQDYAGTAEHEPTLEIHPLDAAARGIVDGTPVQITNERGAFEARAVVTDKVRPGVVSAPSIWWLGRCPTGRNANAVTSQALTDLGGGATFYDTVVEVRKAGP